MATQETPQTPTDPIQRINSILTAEDSSSSEIAVRDQKGRFVSVPRGPARQAEPEGDGEAPMPHAAQMARASNPEWIEPDQDEETPAEEPTEAPAEEPTEGEEAEGEAQEEGIQSFTELAEALEIEPDALAENLTVDGPEGPVKLSDVIKDYANAQNATETAREYEERRGQLEQFTTERVQQLDDELGKATRLVGKLIENMRGERPDWNRLREEDPESYLRQRESWVQRDEAVREALAELQNFSATRGQLNEQDAQRITQEEVTKLQRAKPEWRNLETAKTAFGEMKEYLKGHGFGEQEIEQLVDHRMVLVVWDALSGHRAKKSRPDALRKIAEAKARTKAGIIPTRARQGDVSQTAKRAAAARARLRKSGRMEDAAAAFEEIL